MVQGGRRPGRRGRGAVRGLDRQGRLRGAVAGRRRASPRSWCPRATPSTSAPSWPSSATATVPAPRPSRRRTRPPPSPKRSLRRSPSREPEPAAEPEPAEPEPAEPGRRRRPPSREPAPGRSPRREPGDRGRGRPRGRRRRVLSPLVRRLIAEHGLDPASHRGHRRRRPHHPHRRARRPPRPGAGAPRRGPSRPGRAGGRRRRLPAPASAARSSVHRRRRDGDHARVPLNNIRKRTGEHMVRSKADLAPRAHRHRGRLRGRRPGPPGPPGRVQGRGGLQPHLPAVRRPGGGRRPRGLPPPQRLGRRGRAARAPLRPPGHRRRPRLRGPARAGRARRRGQAPPGHRPRDPATWPPGPDQKKLSADDIAGGTFTITNPGQYGTLMQFPVINQPQVAILSTDGVHRKPVVVTDADGTEAIAIHSVGILALALGPPGLRRRLRRRLPGPAARTSSRPATGQPSS